MTDQAGPLGLDLEGAELGDLYALHYVMSPGPRKAALAARIRRAGGRLPSDPVPSSPETLGEPEEPAHAAEQVWPSLNDRRSGRFDSEPDDVDDEHGSVWRALGPVEHTGARVFRAGWSPV